MKEVHPSIQSLFCERGWEPFEYQKKAWHLYLQGYSGLVHASTGTGKTLAAWLGPLLEWLLDSSSSIPPSTGCRVLWITPLRALAADTLQSLSEPLRSLEIPWTVETRTGDTPASMRLRQRERLPSALITTPESISLLLSYPGSRRHLSDLKCVVVDEWHELLGSKRGVQTELALARLRAWNPELRVWGLSATLGNLDEALQVLVGSSDTRSKLVQGAIEKRIEFQTLLPSTIDRFPWAGHLGLRLLPDVLRIIEESNSCLLFTNTRSQTERWYQEILDKRPDWAGQIAVHHGSLDKKVRRWVEESLNSRVLRCVVCTSSLDLGVDFSPVDRVIQVGSPKSVARLMQRAGRSGHQPDAVSRLFFVPTNAWELVEIAAAREALGCGYVESRGLLEKPFDVLAQHLVTIASGGGFESEPMLREVRRTHSYRGLLRKEWDWILDFITRGGASLKVYPQFRRVVRDGAIFRVADEGIAGRHRLSVGTITSDAVVQVRYLNGRNLGNVEESFAARLRPGDRFVFAGKVLEMAILREMTLWVRRSASSASVIPKWMGGRMPLSSELSAGLRSQLGEAATGGAHSIEMKAVMPLIQIQSAWSLVPGENEFLVEKVQSSEGHHLFFYPFEGRLVHEGLSALLAFRLSRLLPISFSLSANDYGFELLSSDPAPLEKGLEAGLLSVKRLEKDIRECLNSSEMASRHFREIARIAGLVFQGYPGRPRKQRDLQASSGLIFQVLNRYDPEHLLLWQADREVLEKQLEQSRLRRSLQRLSEVRLKITEPARPTPLGFPLVVDRLRSQVSSESLTSRIKRMTLALEKEAPTTAAGVK